MEVKGPHIDWMAISPMVALTAGVCVLLLAGLLRSRFARHTVVPLLALVTLGAAAGLTIAVWHRSDAVIAGAMQMDDLTHFLTLLFCLSCATCFGQAVISGLSRGLTWPLLTRRPSS